MFLNASKISCGYDKTKIVENCNIFLKKGQIASIVGPNGAGKSTAMKAIFGLLPLYEGNVFFNNENISKLKPQERVLKGMSFVPQTNNIFQSMTVEENLEMGGFIRENGIKETINQVYDLFPILKDKKKQIAENLSGGQRQQLAFGRALMTKPNFLMLDEPSAGVSPIVMEDLFKKIIDISRQGVSILMVEQNAKQALKISDIGFVLNQGKNKFTDSGKNLLSNSEVRESFLGG
ncbi:MAG: ABC transporter ATP-binding protein [SAR116 cluster bacterium]|nr:ABC transporter ATP-binding protein [SAR116 cluster bacterium]MAQ07652.1 ABC transporter ATP-binding protein [SAR116 cluster bacterium]